MTGPLDDVGEEGGSTLVAEYEQLRSAALGTTATGWSGRGLAVFVRRGLAAWMHVAGAVRSSSGASSPPPSSSGAITAVPEVAAPEMVTILTRMVLAASPRRTV